ncbi:MAG: TonB-dependent receptor [Burkholderiales bacterium]|nr:TonB-dependent receptor [Burkholderiales bacterium]
MTHRPPRFRLLGSPVRAAALTLLGGMAAAPALAQTAAAPAAAASAPDRAAPASTAPDKPAASATLQEVVITATKRKTTLLKTPVAVTAINAESLERANMSTILDIVHLVPSFQATAQGDHGVLTMTLRGIGNDSAKTEYADPEVALFVNGVYTARPEGAASLMFDMEGVEILRGPQGTLWGRNSTVGAINFQTARPVLGQTFGSAEFGVGTYGREGARATFNVPISSTVALRLAYAHEQHDGYVDYQNPTRYTLAQQQAAWAASGGAAADFRPINYNLFVQGGPKYSAQDQTAVRLSLLVKPSATLSWDVSYERFQDRGTLPMSLMQTPREGQKFWSALIDTAPYLHRDSDVVRSRVDWDVDSSMRLSYIAGYSKFFGASTYDQDLGVTAPTSFATGATYQEDRTNWSRYTSHSHEVQLQSTGKQTLDWILGLYYGAENNAIRFDIPIMNGTQVGTVGWQGSFIQPKETVDTKAAFGQLTYNVSDDLHLTGGARYTQDKRANVGGRGHGWAYSATVPAVAIDPGLNPAAPGSGFNDGCCNDGTYSSSKATGLARVSFDLSADSMVYASVATGYKGGGLQDGGDKYDPETLTSYEIGNKLRLLGNTLTLATAVYHSDFKGYQFAGPLQRPDGSRAFGFANAEGAKVSGLEMELAAKPTPDDRLNVTLALTKTKLGKLLAFSRDYTLPTCTDPIGSLASAQCQDVTGNEMPHAPRVAATVLYEHTVHLGSATLAPRLSVKYESASWLSVFNLGEGDRQKAYARVDLGLRYAEKGWYVDTFLRNAGDGKVKTSAGSNGTIFTAQYLPPRTLGVNVGMEF